jgi:hypothetical protein
VYPTHTHGSNRVEGEWKLPDYDYATLELFQVKVNFWFD